LQTTICHRPRFLFILLLSGFRAGASGGLTMHLKTLSLAVLSLAAVDAARADSLSHLPLITDIAPTAVAISPHVPKMGVHYADPATLPLGPVYCVIEGRVVCVEYMFAASALAAGESWQAMPVGFETPPINHVDFEYKPDGVGPNPVPIYQLHIYFVDPQTLATH
jgi:hypothetical protein